MRKLLWFGSVIAIAIASGAVVFSAFGPADKEVRGSGAASPYPLHFWVSNQSLGTGIEEVWMRVTLDDVDVILDQLMAVGMQHNVEVVDRSAESGEHDVEVEVFVNPPYDPPPDVETVEVVDVQGETWVLVAYFYDPVSAHVAQHTPTIEVTVLDTEPGIK